MSTSRLRAAIATHAHVPALETGIAGVLGSSSLSEIAEDTVRGHHIVSSDTSIAIYVVTRDLFALYEATADGRRLSVAVPRERWRRLSLYEDPNGAQLTLEFDADRASLNGTLSNDGSVTATLDCASYTIIEGQLAGIESLKAYARAFARALHQ